MHGQTSGQLLPSDLSGNVTQLFHCPTPTRELQETWEGGHFSCHNEMVAVCHLH